MKRISSFLMLVTLITACQIPPGVDLEDGTKTASLLGLTGTWTWVRTEGSGIAGPYVRTIQDGDSETRTFLSGSKVKIDRNIGGTQTSETFTYDLSSQDGKYVIAYYLDGTVTNKEFVEKEGANKLEFSNYEDCCDNTYDAHFVKETNGGE